jgi:hypothetical protein
VIRKLLALIAAAALITSLASTAGAKPKKAAKPSGTAFQIATAGPKFTSDGTEMQDGEPSIAVGPGGWLYTSWPGDAGMNFYSSHNGGRTWVRGGNPQEAAGDTTLNVDTSGAVYQSNLHGIDADPNTLEIEAFKSLDHGKTWTLGTAETLPTEENSTNQPFRVDRQWLDGYTPPGKGTDETREYISYHTFVDGLIWANTSKDGGKTFGDPVNVVTDPAAVTASLCNTIPGGTKVAKAGPHAGRVYVAWIAGDLAANLATGCNYTQLQTFHTVWVAYSDDEGATWTDKLVYDAGFGHDAGALFADLAVDRAGNPYLAFTINLADQWDAYVSASFDGGDTWNTASGGAPSKVTSDKGTHLFAAIDAGAPGKVDIAYLASKSLIPTLPYGKPAPGGVADATWDVFMSQSLNFRSAHPRWTTTRITERPMHVGDVCVLGIFCLPGISNRDLLDFIDVVVDPAGRAHIAYTDDSDRDCICVANQTAGPTVK